MLAGLCCILTSRPTQKTSTWLPEVTTRVAVMRSKIVGADSSPLRDGISPSNISRRAGTLSDPSEATSVRSVSTTLLRLASDIQGSSAMS